MEAIRQLGNELPRGTAVYLHLTLMPYIPAAGELKTKPTQHSVKELQALGIAPDILLVRADREIRKQNAASFPCSATFRPSAVIQALDVANIYDVPTAIIRKVSTRKCWQHSVSNRHQSRVSITGKKWAIAFVPRKAR